MISDPYPGTDASLSSEGGGMSVRKPDGYLSKLRPSPGKVAKSRGMERVLVVKVASVP